MAATTPTTGCLSSQELAYACERITAWWMSTPPGMPTVPGQAVPHMHSKEILKHSDVGDLWICVACLCLQYAKHAHTHKCKNKSMDLLKTPGGTIKGHFLKTWAIWPVLSVLTSFATLSVCPLWGNLSLAWYVEGFGELASKLSSRSDILW